MVDKDKKTETRKDWMPDPWDRKRNLVTMFYTNNRRWDKD